MHWAILNGAHPLQYCITTTGNDKNRPQHNTALSMKEVSLHSRAWDRLEDELEHDIEEYERYGRTGRADDLRHTLNQIRDQRSNGSDPEGADLGRYEEKMEESLS